MLLLVAAVAGCAAPRTASPASVAAADDPLAQPEVALASETLPGQLAGPWPTPVARGGAAWLIPWRDGEGVHVRLVGDDGAREDRRVGPGTLMGAVALDDGFAVALAAGGLVRVHFLAASGDEVAVAATSLGGGNAVPGAAGDGAGRVLVAATRGGDFAVPDPSPLDATLLLIGRDGTRAIDLDRVAAAPTLWGDTRGFIVSGVLLVDGDGQVMPAPGRQIRDARVFRQPIAAGTQPASDIISFDGEAWTTIDGFVGWAARDAAGARLEVVGPESRALVEVGDDLTPRVRHVLPATTRGDGGQAWVAAASTSRVVWASTVDDDPVFVLLDAHDLHADSGVIRIRGATSRATVVSPGAAGVLMAWTEARGTVRYAVAQW